MPSLRKKMFGDLTTINQLGSSVAGLMVAYATFQQFCPDFVRDYVKDLGSSIVAYFDNEIHIKFFEFDSSGYRDNDAYRAIDAYLGARSTDVTSKATRLRGEKADKRSSTKCLTFALDEYEEIIDLFEGVNFKWLYGKVVPKGVSLSHSSWDDERRYYSVTFNRQYRNLVIDKYLNHVMAEGEAVLKKRRTRMLYTNKPGSDWASYKNGIWRKFVFEHPATFANLAMEPEKKEEIIQDLITFTKCQNYYVKIGKPWKRGYLLYGPPGTGKSTMVACMANLLGYDIYDIELTTVKNNGELRNLLVNTNGKSIILIEDIDCTLPCTASRADDNADSDSDSDSDNADSDKKNDFKVDGREAKDSTRKSTLNSKSEVTLSGILNIIDGLWSPCSEERIIVFTTNHIEKLDPALIRTGRMDKHIEMSYCTFDAFKIFARNYLDIESHPLFDRIEMLLSETNVSPSDIAENLLPKSGHEEPEKRLEAVIQALEKAKENQKGKSEQKMKMKAKSDKKKSEDEKG